jgi:CheY-like chemotaxis protein
MGGDLEKTAVLVLIAEDQAEIGEVLKDSFEDGGYDVLLAVTAEEALAALDARGEEVRALVTDIKLGSSTTGWDVARHARELKPEMPVVYMTGSESSDWPSLGVPNSILVPKPFAPAQVITAISQLLNSSSTPGA